MKLNSLDFTRLPEKYIEHEIVYEDLDFLWFAEFVYHNSIIDFMRATKKTLEQSTLKLEESSTSNESKKVVANECVRLINVFKKELGVKDGDLNNYAIHQYAIDELFELLNDIKYSSQINIRKLRQDEYIQNQNILKILEKKTLTEHFFNDSKTYLYIVLNIFYHCKWFTDDLMGEKMRVLPSELAKNIEGIKPTSLKDYLQIKRPRTNPDELRRYQKIKNVIITACEVRGITLDQVTSNSPVLLNSVSLQFINDIIVLPLKVHSNVDDFSQVLNVSSDATEDYNSIEYLLYVIDKLIC